MAKKRNIIVGQSGGPTAVINSSLAGVYKNAIERGFDKVYGMLHGIQGLLDEQYIDLSTQIHSELDIELLKRTPSAFLGSTTGNPTQTTFFFFVKNPAYVNLLVGIVNHCLLFPSGTKVFGKILIQKRRLNFMTLCYGILTIGTSSSFSRSSCFTGQNEVFSTTE